MGREIALHRIGGQHRQSGFTPVGTPGAVSFDAILASFQRTFDSIMRDSNAAARQHELLSALDGLFATTARARASATDCQPVERALHSTLFEQLLLRRFSLNRELESMKRAVIEYLFQLELQHLREAAASLARSTWVQMASTRPEVCGDMLSVAISTIVRTCAATQHSPSNYSHLWKPRLQSTSSALLCSSVLYRCLGRPQMSKRPGLRRR